MPAVANALARVEKRAAPRRGTGRSRIASSKARSASPFLPPSRGPALAKGAARGWGRGSPPASWRARRCRGWTHCVRAGRGTTSSRRGPACAVHGAAEERDARGRGGDPVLQPRRRDRPVYPQAHAGLADCWSYLYLYRERSESNRDNAERASLQAVTLDPESAQAQASRGLALSISGRNGEAERAFEEAIRLDPSLFEAHYFYARHAFATGEAAKALRLYEEAMRARPEDYQSPLLAAQIYDDDARPGEAAAARRLGVERATRRLELEPDDVRALYMAANGLAALGESDRAREWAQRARALRPDDGMVLYNVACVLALLGLVEDALECLDEAVRNGLRQRGWYEHDSNLDPLRSHQRFQKLLQEL